MMDQGRNPEVDPGEERESTTIEHRKDQPEVEEGDRSEDGVSADGGLEPHWSKWKDNHEAHLHFLVRKNAALIQKRKDLNIRCLLSIIGIMSALPPMVAYLEVVGPFFAVQHFVETTCHVVSVNEDDRGTGCRKVHVDYAEREAEDDVTPILHLNENHLYYDRCYPEPIATLCSIFSQLDPPGTCSIPCLYDPLDNSRVIKHLTYEPIDVIISVSSLAAFALSVILFILASGDAASARIEHQLHSTE